MRIRRRATLVCTFEDTRTVIHDFLTRSRFEAGKDVAAALGALDDWQDMESACLAVADATGETDRVREIIRELIEAELVIIEGSPESESDRSYRDAWRWGAVAGFYQFSLRDADFIDGPGGVERMERYREEGDMPPLLTTNRELQTRIPLPDFDLDDPFFRVLAARESNRHYSGDPITLAELADCLFSGNGVKNIKGYGAFGELPKCMTPSGGARNPLELYVYARAVDGLAPGFYHYSSLDHDLGFLHAEELPEPSALLGGQQWSDQAAAVIFITANFERTGWKYRQPLAYRVVLMETGYVGQNLLLAATRHRLAAAPTGALAESHIETLLGLDGIRDAALFAIVLGQSASSS